MTAVNLDLSGWILRKPKVAESNAPTTSSPDNMILSGFVPSERADYLVVALGNGYLHEIKFAWVKNEARNQFGFSDEDQRWKPFPGQSPSLLGAISNTERLIVAPIPDGAYPYRLYITDPSSSSLTTYNVVTSFSAPSSLSAGTVEILESTGELNFSQDDVDSFSGENVYYQSESFIDYTEENRALLGVLDSPLSSYRLALNPIPDTTQIPIIRIGNRVPLEVVSVATETGFGSPGAGIVEWARDKGTLNFSASDISTYEGENVYYWGVYDHVDSSAGLTSNVYDLGSIDISAPSNPTTTLSIPSGSVPESGGDVVVYFINSDYRRISKTTIVDSFSDVVKYGEVELKTDGTVGTVRLNYAEARSYVGWDVYLAICDYELSGEDIAVRYFRSLINKDGSDSNIPDLSCFFTVEDQVLVEKLIATPIQILPVSPIEPPLPSYVEPDFRVEGESTISLQNLKENPSTGPGFLINYDTKELTIARRKNFDVKLVSDSVFYNFDDVGLLGYDFDLKTGPLGGSNTDLTLGDDYLLESNGGAVFFINRFGKTLSSGTKGEIVSTTSFEDITADFTGYTGKQLVILSGSNKGSYLIDSVVSTTEITVDSSIPFSTLGSKIGYEIWDSPEILADRVWEEVPIPEEYFKLKKQYPLGAISNSPRLTLPIVPPELDSERVVLELNSVSLTISLVATDGKFRSPVAGDAEVSIDTGNINFSSSDLSTYAGQDVWVSWWLRPSEYIINPSNGSVYLNTPLLNWEKLQASYYLEEGGDLQEEFLKIRLWGEECSVTPGSTSVQFNTDGRETDSNLGVYVYRGNVNTSVGRFYPLSPTQTSDKVVVDWGTHTLEFIDPLTAEDEVTVEYYVVDALGGERAFNLTSFPIFFPSYTMNEGSNSFEVYGDMTSVFLSNRYLLIDDQDTYKVTSSVYASGKTTVSLASEFRSSYLLDTFLISSDVLDSNYFNPVPIKFEKTQKGSYELRFKGEVSGITVGTILNLDGDDYLVLGADVINGVTIVQVGSKFPLEYSYSLGFLEASIRPIFTNNSVDFVSSLPIVSTEPFVLNKRNEALGTFDELVLDIDYSLSESGALLLLTTTVTSDDCLEFNYAGQKTYDAGQKFSGQYIYRYMPDEYLGSSLIASYTVYNPDSIYFRVEPFSTISNEVSAALGEAAASSLPSSGPPSPPPPPPDLYEKGKDTFYWEYGDTVDSDSVARRYLMYYNNLCNLVEDLLSYLDGRVIGDSDGKFKFTDSLYTSPVEPYAAVNQIDSVIYISPSTFPERKSQAMWKASKYSRLYPEFERFFGQTIPTSGGGPGYFFPDEFLTEIFDIGRENLAVVSSVKDRPARTLLSNTIPAGKSSATLEVENADEDSEFFTPTFEINDEVMIGRTSDPYLVAGIVTAVDTGSSPNTITVTFVSYNTTPTLPPPPGTTCPELLPNDTVYHNPFWWEDDGDGNAVPHLKTYQNGLHYAPDLKSGTLLNMQLPGFDMLFPETNLDGLASFGNPLTAPYRFPALYGQILNDDGDRSVPFRVTSASNFDGLFEDEEGLIDDIIASTLEGIRGTDGAVLSDLQTFDGSWSGANLETNDLLILLTGSNIGQYLVSSMPASDQVKLATFEHQQDDTVDYEIWDPTETTLRASGTTGSILSDLLTLEDTSKNFSTAGVLSGDKLILNSTTGYFNSGTYWIQTVATTTVSARAFGSSETGVEFDIKRGTGSSGRFSGDTGYFNTTTQFIDLNADFEADTVKGDALVISEGKNRGNWRIDSVDSTTQITLQDSVRVAETGSGNIVSPNRLDTTGTFFQSSDVGRKFIVSGSTDNDGTYTIASFIDENSVTVTPSWPGTTPDTCTWSLCCDYKVDDVRRESQYIADWRTKLLEEQTELQSSSFQDLIDDLFDTFYGVSPLDSGISGAVTGTHTFQDTSKDFDALDLLGGDVLGLLEGDVLEIGTGANAGKWWIESVSGDTITISESFPSVTSGILYEVWQGDSRFSTDLRQTLIDLIAMVDLALADISATLPYSIIDTTPDYGDPTDTFLNSRKTDIQNFRSDFSELSTRFETALQFIDKWYDKRYGWIDYRVNLGEGTLPTKERLLAEKVKTEEDLIQKLLMSLG